MRSREVQPRAIDLITRVHNFLLLTAPDNRICPSIRRTIGFYLALFFEVNAIFNKFTTGASKAREMQNDRRYDATRLPK